MVWNVPALNARLRVVLFRVLGCQGDPLAPRLLCLGAIRVILLWQTLTKISLAKSHAARMAQPVLSLLDKGCLAIGADITGRRVRIIVKLVIACIADEVATFCLPDLGP